jgi:parallel beta-helix repeat protein
MRRYLYTKTAFSVPSLLIFFLAATIPYQSVAQCVTGTVTINSNLAGSDPANGQYKNFNDLATQLSICGVSGNVTAIVAPGSGPYREQVIFKNINGLGPNATLTIQGNGATITSDTAIIQTGSNPNRHIIRLTDLQYVTIDSLNVDMFPGSTGFMGVHILNTGSNITINRVKVNMGTGTSTLLGGIAATGSESSLLSGGTFSNITISNCTTTAGGYGAVLYGLAATKVANSRIQNNSFNTSTSWGVYVYNNAGTQISNNKINISTGGGILLAGSSTNVNHNVLVEKNTISATNPTTSGTLRGIQVNVNTAGSLSNKIVNNLIWKMSAPTATVNGLESAATGAEFYHNTIILDDATATGPRTFGFVESSSNTGSILKNNIFYVTRPSSLYGAAIGLSSSSTPATAITSNNNVFHTAGTNNHMGVRQAASSTSPPTTTYTLATWRTATGEDLASVEANPDFQSGTAIPSNAVINNIGDPSTGVTTDITGTTRGANPDPGGYEFSPSTNDAAITNFVSPAAPYCANTLNVQFVLTNAGGVTLTSATINWTVNGAAQPVVNWTGSLAPGASTNVSLGTVAVTGTTVYSFSATVSNPNGQADANAGNNTFTHNGFRRGISGAVTINSTAAPSATNYQTFSALATELSSFGVCGAVTVNVVGGPYTEQVVFNPIPGSSAANTITLNGGNNALQFNPTVSTADHVLQLNGVNYMTIENLNVTSQHATQGRGIHITNQASYITLRNNMISVSTTNTASTTFGIIVSGANYLLDGSASQQLNITGNTISGGFSCIQFSGVNFNSVSNKVRNSIISGNTLRDFYAAGIYLSYTDSITVRGNQISRPTRTSSGSDFQTPAGITIPAGSTNFLLDKNRIFNLETAMPTSTTISRGIYLSGTNTAVSNGTIQNNLIYGFGSQGSNYGIQNNSTTGPVNILHNTLALDNTGGTGTASAIYLSNSSAPSGLSIRNNIFYVTRGGTGAKRIFDISGSSTTFTSNHNVAYLSPVSGPGIFARVGSTDYATLADWQNATGLDLQSSSADPQFTNLGTGDLKPTNMAIDGGTMNTPNVGVADDYFGTTRATNPDPGAIEFGGIIYTFTGNGNWNTPSNWAGNQVPPSPLPSGSEIIINPSDADCILNVPYTVGPGGKLTVKAGRSFIVQGNLTIQQ